MEWIDIKKDFRKPTDEPNLTVLVWVSSGDNVYIAAYLKAPSSDLPTCFYYHDALVDDNGNYIYPQESPTHWAHIERPLPYSYNKIE